MFAKPIEALISGAGANAITEAFIVVMLGAFIYAIYAKRLDKAPAFCQYTPTLLTSLGILGTFCGIVAGLLGFDIANIDGSIDKLLMGMKTAFTTSLVGMGLSIVFKALSSMSLLNPKSQGEEPVETAIGIRDLYQVMREQRDGILHLQNSIAGEHQSSLNGQIQALRAESKQNLLNAQKEAKHQQVLFQAFQKNLWLKLDHFADNLSQAAAEQMAKAQQTVIKDFNTHFSEQFGGNFERLNTAVQEMVHWQENYRGQLEDMRSNYDQSVKAISQTEHSLVNINTQTEAIAGNLESWQSVMEVNQHQIQELERHLESFAQMRDKAVEAAPELQSHIEKTLSGVQAASEELSKGLRENASELQRSFTEGAEQYQQGNKALEAVFKQTQAEISQGNEQLSATYKQNAAELQSSFTEGAEQYQQGNKALEAIFQQTQSEISQGNEQLSAAYTQSASELNEAAKQLSLGSEATQKALLENAELLREKAEQTQQVLAEGNTELNKQFEKLGKDIGLDSQEFSEQIRESGNALLRVAGRSREAFDNDMQSMVEQVTDSLQQMASQQAEESLKIVELHIKLTQDLHRILTHAN